MDVNVFPSEYYHSLAFVRGNTALILFFAVKLSRFYCVTDVLVTFSFLRKSNKTEYIHITDT